DVVGLGLGSVRCHEAPVRDRRARRHLGGEVDPEIAAIERVLRRQGRTLRVVRVRTGAGRNVRAAVLPRLRQGKGLEGLTPQWGLAGLVFAGPEDALGPSIGRAAGAAGERAAGARGSGGATYTGVESH